MSILSEDFIVRERRDKRDWSHTLELEEKVYGDAAAKLPNRGELEIANVKHNLANCLRMLGAAETVEAKAIEADVLSIAQKHGDRALARKAEFLMGRLSGAPIPDYYDGEKEEDIV